MGCLEETEVLVTGGTGFIGSHLVRKLVEEKAIVNVISRKRNLNMHFFLQDICDKIKIWKSDLLNPTSLKKCITRINPRKVFHLGAFVNSGCSLHIVRQCIQTNIQGTANLLHVLREADADLDCFIYAGTYEVYGTGYLKFNEKHAIHPLSPYSISKAAGEFFCAFAQETLGIPIVILRLSHVYGPNQSLANLIPYVIACCLNNENPVLTQGDQEKDFIYVSDVVKAMLKSSCEKKAIGEIINIGKGETHTIRSVVMKIINIMNSSVTPLFGALSFRNYESKYSACSISKAKKILKWKPQIELEEGLKRTISWYSKFFDRGNRCDE